jgi:IS30 family transposase
MRRIGERPKVVTKREHPGDWEGNTMIGKDHRQPIVVNVERRSVYCWRRK